MTDFIDRTRHLMERLRIKTIRELAQASNLDERKVGAYLRGDRFPDSRNLLSLAQALNTSVEYLLTGKEHRDPDRRGDYRDVEALGSRESEDRGLGRGGFSDIDFLPIRQAITRKYGRGDYEFLKVSDSSMEPTFSKGGIVAFKKERIRPPSLNRGQTKNAIWCLNVRDESGIIIRKVRFLEKENYLELIPINILKHDVKRYRPRDITILGRVIGIAWQDL